MPKQSTLQTTDRQLAKIVLLPGENRARFKQLLASLRAELQPESFVDNHYIETLAIYRWRQQRFFAAQADLYKRQISPELPAIAITKAIQALPVTAATETLHYFVRKERHFARQFNATRRQYLALRSPAKIQGKIKNSAQVQVTV